MVPKDELIKIHTKIIENPLNLIIKKDLSNSKKPIQNYLDKMNKWFKKIESTDIDKKNFNDFLDTYKENILEILQSEIDMGSKSQIKTVSFEFIKSLEIHCSFLLRSKLRFINDSIKDEREDIAKLKLIGRILIPIIVLILILTTIFATYYFISNYNSENQVFSLNSTMNSNNNPNSSSNSSLSSTSPIPSKKENQETVNSQNNSNTNNNEEIVPSVDTQSQSTSKPTSTPKSTTSNTYELSQTEKELFNLINKQRIKFYKPALKLNLELSKLLKAHTNEMSNTYKITNVDSNSTMITRANSLNITTNIREDNFYQQYTSGILSEVLFEKSRNDNLFLEEQTHIALSVTEGEYKTYFVTIDTYKEIKEE